MPAVSPDPGQCTRVGLRIGSLALNPAFYNREFITFDADRETKLRIYLLSAAICHQTHSLHHPGLNLWGWEYLEYGMLRMLKSGRALLNPGYVSLCNPLELSGILRKTFSPDGDPAHSTLDRIDERSRFLQELCSYIKSYQNGQVANFIDQAGGRIGNGETGLYAMLAPFEAFSDPYRKKITFFVKLAADAGILRIRDPENIVPIMDYHMQRVLLRLGCIRFQGPALKEKLIQRVELEDDGEIRSACIEAVRIIGKVSGMSLLFLNDVFWPLGRSCCEKTTLCTEGFCLKTPCTLTHTLKLDNHSKCIFHDQCKGRIDISFRSLWEPNVKTSYY